MDRVQILHLHDPEHARDLSEITGPGGSLEELFKMKEEGLADAVGLAMGRLDIMFPILRDLPFDALINHNRWSLLNQSAAEMYRYAHAKDIAVLNAAPFAGGVLAKGADVMPKISYTPADEEALAPVRRIEEICAAEGAAPGAAALQFSMRTPEVMSTIVGVSKPERVAQTLDWASADLSDDLWAALESLPVDMSDPEAHRNYSPE